MSHENMPVTLRFSKTEQKELEVKCREINKRLIQQEQRPISESELAHFILGQGIQLVSVEKSGALVLES